MGSEALPLDDPAYWCNQKLSVEIQVKLMDNYTTVKVPVKFGGLLSNLIDIIHHHYKREQDLVQIIYERFTQQELADRLHVTRQAISLQYPKGGNK